MVQNGGWKRMCLRQCSCSSWLCSFHSLHCRPAGMPEKLTREKKKQKWRNENGSNRKLNWIAQLLLRKSQSDTVLNICIYVCINRRCVEDTNEIELKALLFSYRVLRIPRQKKKNGDRNFNDMVISLPNVFFLRSGHAKTELELFDI